MVVAAQLSGDTVLSKEIRDKLDSHQDNQDKFRLPNRLTAKRFIFKLLYGATDYGFYTDPDFFEVGYSQKEWADVIEKFYIKYYGIKKWHDVIIDEAKAKGRLEIPSGRYFPYAPTYQRGEFKWPITTIKNYPIQGFGADLVKLARLEAKKNLKASGLEALLVSTIHDSIVVDAPAKNLDSIARILLDAVESVPTLCKQVWDYDSQLPLTADVQYGPNKRDMQDFKFT